MPSKKTTPVSPYNPDAPYPIVAGTDYLCANGETTGPLKWKPDFKGDPQPWYSPKLRWYFDVYGTSGAGMETNGRRIVGEVES